MDNIVKRVNSLVPDAIFGTQNGDITTWGDTRPQPSDTALAAVDVDAIELAEQTAKQETTDELKNSPITGITYAQAESYIDSNITDQGTATVCKKMARLLLAVVKQQGLSS